MDAVRIASAEYPIERLPSWTAFEDKLARMTAEAAGQGAQVLVYPEYAAMELAALLGDALAADLHGQLVALQDLFPDYLALYRRLAAEYRVHILAGSYPVRDTAGRFRNRAYLCTPEGACDYQEKLIMTRFEREEWDVSAGTGLKVFDTAVGRLAVNLCYDSEFPLLARAQAEAGAELLLVPSCTDTAAGYHRVRIACRARAMENQFFAVQSPTVGEAPWSAAVDVNIGQAGIFGPVESAMHPDGVVATERAGPWACATLDLAAARRMRERGQVLNFRDWPRQAAEAAARRVTLGPG